MSSGGVKQYDKGQILFRENDPSDAMFVIKKGRISITKTKGSGYIELAELGPGQMLGEMAFFDNKPRSAGAVAKENVEIIELPFTALHAQFKTFPEWLKAMVKTVNSHLRAANQKIKNLEKVQAEDEEFFPPHLITRLCAIISLMGFKAGVEDPEGGGLVIPSGTLRNYCIQVFQQPTHKLNRLIEVLASMQIMKTEDLGEGNIKTIILEHKQLTDFVDWYNKWLFGKEEDKLAIEEKEMVAVKALLFYGKSLREANDAGDDAKDKFVTVDLTEIQNNSMRDLNIQFTTNDCDGLAEKGFTEDKVSGASDNLTMRFDYDELNRIYPFWQIIYALKNTAK
ncbi:MAG: porin [Bdellovibrionaceae bacterium]|nr:porin [Pseudobdellovibrionaceae bacterium]|tara:strand:+ start:76311 stop:77327 length:1017 start_codon:yes stop_codon:yes gene_type:complete